jgi:hypothetical protein
MNDRPLENFNPEELPEINLAEYTLNQITEMIEKEEILYFDGTVKDYRLVEGLNQLEDLMKMEYIFFLNEVD